MKFVALASVKGIVIGQPVYTLDSEGVYATGKLVSRTENGAGTSWLFEVPQYFNEDKPAINAVTTTTITYVCVMKDKKTATDEVGTLE